jgi:DNA anti-recombination protein RmuC
VPITEESRHRLFRALEQHLGEEAAVTLMEHLPPVGWSDITTRRDLDHLATATKADLDRTATTLHARIDQVEATLGSRIDQVEATLGSRIDQVEATLGSRIDQVEATLGSRIDQLRTEQARDMRGYGLALITVNATMTALAVGLSQAL